MSGDTEESRGTEQGGDSTDTPVRATPTGGATVLLNDQDRSRILSTTRLKVILSVFVVALLLGLGALAFFQVSRIFDELTPAVAHDLSWKTERGAAELSFTTELALALGDAEAIRAAAKTYLDDGDVKSLIVKDSQGQVLFAHPAGQKSNGARLFSGPPGRARESTDSFVAWLPVDIEGAEIGQVALEVSKDRLEAGAELRQDILKGVGFGSLIAFVVSLFFVSFYIAPLVRMTERAFIDLEQRTHEALESARLKTEFLANMSHEIRTPMNGVIGMGELLNKTTLTKKQRRYVRTISTSASALLTIINDILDFSKIDAGKLAVRPVETDVKRLAEEVAQLLAPQAQSKGVELMSSIGADIPREVMVDHDRLRQILNNIAGNAVKFTNQGSIVIRVWLEEHLRDDDACVLGFSVTDTGIGIAPEDHSKVFEHFSQADGSLTRIAGGTGLGLSISRHLVERMGGSLSLQSELGKGSCFSFKIRVAVVAGEGSRPSGRLPRTLIVDDNQTNRTVFEELFESWGVPNDSARSGAEALLMLAAAEKAGNPFELALLDQLMDGMNGIQLAYEIRKRSGNRAPRLILVTSMSESDQLDSVFDDGLTKPVLQDDLRRVIQGSDNSTRVEIEESEAQREFVGRPRILVAEDNPINREVMREILDELEIDSDLVENGQEAIEAIEKGNYPLVLMDCQMPVLDGYEATRQIRRRKDEKAHLPIVAVTAHAVQGEREKALAAGMTDYITKPVTITRLVRMMSKYLETRTVASIRPAQKSFPADSGRDPSSAPGRMSIADVEGPLPLDPGVRRSPTVVKLFRKMVPDQIAGLKEAIESRDTTEVKQAAHKLKGGCLALGARKMGDLCASLEPFPDNAQQLLKELLAEHAVVLEALSAEMGD